MNRSMDRRQTAVIIALLGLLVLFLALGRAGCVGGGVQAPSLIQQEQDRENKSVAAVRGLIDACKRLQKKQARGKAKKARAR